MMKLYAEFIPKSTPLQELEVSWNIEQMGLKIPAAYRLVTDGKRVGVEFQRITPKQSFARAVSNNPEMMKFYAEAFADECKKLHNTQCSISKFPDVAEKFKDTVHQNPNLTDEEKEKVCKFIDNTPKAQTCIHGDLHIGNIITNGEQNFWIDLSDFAWGNPIYDLCCYYLMTIIPDELIQRLYHLTKEQMVEMWQIFARKYFETENIEEIEKQLAPYCCLYMIRFDNRGNMMPWMGDFIREKLLNT